MGGRSHLSVGYEWWNHGKGSAKQREPSPDRAEQAVAHVHSLSGFIP